MREGLTKVETQLVKVMKRRKVVERRDKRSRRLTLIESVREKEPQKN